MKNIYIIDALHILFRSYFAIGSMRNNKGEATNALYGFIRSLLKLVKEFSPEHLVIVFDGPENKKKRQAIYTEYKSNRAGMPEDLFPQLEKALEFCKLAGLPYLSVPGVEADDTIASIVRYAQKEDSTVFICTGDKDLCQLVTDHVFVLNIHKENRLLDKKKVKEVYGVTPEQIPDYLGLVGDSSDNIPGLEGFGPKTAIQLFEKFATLEEILDHPEEVAGLKKQETIKRDRAIALMSKELALLHDTVEVPQDANFYSFHEPHIDQVREFYQEMNFSSLLKEMGEPKKAPLPKIETDYKVVENLDDLLLDNPTEIAFHLETSTDHPMRAQLLGVAFSWKAGAAVYLKTETAEAKQELQKLFSHPHLSFYGHDVKHDLHVLMNEGIELPHICFDTNLASYLLAPQTQKHSLEAVSLNLLVEETAASSCAASADLTFRIKDILSQKLEKEGLLSVFYTIELPLIPILLKMERSGMYVDPDKLKILSVDLAKQIEQIEKKIYALAGEEFNLNSPKQIAVILFEKLQIPSPSKKGSLSTSADVLETLQVEHPIAKEILSYRSLEKLRSTYVDSLPEQILEKTGRIHCSFNQSVTATGRLSCQNPNLQNIPVRTEEGKKIRNAFCPQKKGWSFLSCDYSQIELRLLAHFSEDPSLIAAFNNGEDIHAYTASQIFDIPLKEVSQEMRYRAKAVNFGILYGQQAYGLSQETGIPYKEAVAFIEKYFQRYSRVKDFLESCKEKAKSTGKAVTLTGRQRPIPEIGSKNPMLHALAMRLAINTPLQGTAADLIKLAMIRIDKLWQEEMGFMILQIHDELLFEVPDHQLEKVTRLVRPAMEEVFDLKVPLIVTISIGKNWGEC